MARWGENPRTGQHHRRTCLGPLLQNAVELLLDERVQLAGGLIQQQQIRLAEQASSSPVFWRFPLDSYPATPPTAVRGTQPRSRLGRSAASADMRPGSS